MRLDSLGTIRPVKLMAERVAQELERAQEARAAGNEGRARVCARRAAAFAIGAWADLPASGWSVPKRLQAVARDARFSADVRAAAHHLTLRVTSDHQLPVDADPLADAQLLVRHFLRNAESPE